jgi:hypothetical protein
MIRLCVALLLALGITAHAPASAQTRAEVYDRIEMLHGEADAFVVAFEILTEGFREGVVDGIARLGDYPFPVEANGELYDILTPQDLIENFDRLIMPETQRALARQEFSSLFVNSDGVMFLDGELWMALVCIDDACAESAWSIIAINN